MADDPIVVDNPGALIDLLIDGTTAAGKVFRNCTPLAHLMILDANAKTQQSRFRFCDLAPGTPVELSLIPAGGKTERIIFSKSSETQIEITVGETRSDPTGTGLVVASANEKRRFRLAAADTRNIEWIFYTDPSGTEHATKLTPGGRHIVFLIPEGNRTAIAAFAKALSASVE
jgi:hypothetical protein